MIIIENVEYCLTCTKGQGNFRKICGIIFPCIFLFCFVFFLILFYSVCVCVCVDQQTYLYKIENFSENNRCTILLLHLSMEVTLLSIVVVFFIFYYLISIVVVVVVVVVAIVVVFFIFFFQYLTFVSNFKVVLLFIYWLLQRQSFDPT